MSEPTNMPAQTLLALVDDLFFILKIGDTAKHLGLTVHFCSSGSELFGRLAHTSASLIIVDLSISGTDLADFFERLKSEAAAPVLGYTTHADWKRTAALHDKCTRVVTKETLSRSLAELIPEVIQHIEEKP